MVGRYEAILVLSFGGPEGRDDVIPFLENVLRGRNVPRERMLEVAEHYYQFGGISPINSQNRALIDALQVQLTKHGPALPIYWGNRNWHPLLPDALHQMSKDGIRKALAFVTSAFSSYSGCRQYLEDIARARAEVGTGAPEVDKLRPFYNHPGFIAAIVDHTSQALQRVLPSRRDSVTLVFTAHSIPLSMAQNCSYVNQLEESCRLVADRLDRDNWKLVYQSRSGPPNQPWLEPDILDYLESVRQRDAAARDVVVIPIGFVSDHMEIIFDLDVEAAQLCQRLGINMVRAATAGTHPEFVRMVRDLIAERLEGWTDRPHLGRFDPNPDICPPTCCRKG